MVELQPPQPQQHEEERVVDALVLLEQMPQSAAMVSAEAAHTQTHAGAHVEDGECATIALAPPPAATTAPPPAAPPPAKADAGGVVSVVAVSQAAATREQDSAGGAGQESKGALTLCDSAAADMASREIGCAIEARTVTTGHKHSVPVHI